MSSFQEGWQQGQRIGNVITLAFRILWFFFRIAWWLSVFLVACLVAGIAALIKLGQPRPDMSADFGCYSDDRTRWQDAKSSTWYPVRNEDHEACQVQATMGGMNWRRTALSRLVKRGAVVNYTFSARLLERPDHAQEIVASEEFLNEARRNITLDDLDPEQASSGSYADNRDEVVSALEHLDWILTNRGWEQTDQLAGHWYARIYTRPKILWDHPISSEPDEIATLEA